MYIVLESELESEIQIRNYFRKKLTFTKRNKKQQQQRQPTTNEGEPPADKKRSQDYLKSSKVEVVNDVISGGRKSPLSTEVEDLLLLLQRVVRSAAVRIKLAIQKSVCLADGNNNCCCFSSLNG